MEKEFLEWLKTFTINPATLLAINVVIVTFIIKGTDFYYDVKQRLYARAEKKVNKNIADKCLSEIIETLSQSVNTLSADLKEMKSTVDAYKDEITDLKSKLSTYETDNSHVISQINKIDGKVDMLMDSDKESIRAFILNEFHKWEPLNYIDVYSLAVCEDKYKKYVKENGNTFVKDIMEELRHMEKRFTVLKDGKDPIQYYEIQANKMNYNIIDHNNENEDSNSSKNPND